MYTISDQVLPNFWAVTAENGDVITVFNSQAEAEYWCDINNIQYTATSSN